MITVLAQINTLPGTHRQAAGLDRQTQLAAQETGLEVRRQIIRTFVIVFEPGTALRHQQVEKTLEVTANRRIGILVDGQRSRGVLQPQV